MDILEVCTMLVCCEEVGFSHEQSEGKFSLYLVHVAGREITPHLVGDSAYPLSARDSYGMTFNKEVFSARVQVERAFGMLKNRWRILQKCFESKIKFAITCKATIACAVLHNICL